MICIPIIAFQDRFHNSGKYPVFPVLPGAAVHMFTKHILQLAGSAGDLCHGRSCKYNYDDVFDHLVLPRDGSSVWEHLMSCCRISTDWRSVFSSFWIVSLSSFSCMMNSAALLSCAALLILIVGSRDKLGTTDRSTSNPFLIVPFRFFSAFLWFLSSTKTTEVELPVSE